MCWDTGTASWSLGEPCANLGLLMNRSSTDTANRSGLAALVLLMATGCGGNATQSAGETGGTGGQGTGGGVGVGGNNTGGTATGGAAGTGGSGTGGTAGCTPACGEGRECCAGECVNPANDPHNCGTCGTRCTGDDYCTGGECVPPPCSTTCTSGSCCGEECCAAGQICCDPQGPLDTGPHCTPPSDQETCPQGCAPLCICASPDTPIATPSGDRPIVSLRVGDLVYSVDGAAVKAVPLVLVHRTAVEQHRVVRVKFSNGTKLEISAGHPTADGRTFGDLRAGGMLDQKRIQSAELVPYGHEYTYDILPDSDSGTYFAGGELIGSTLQGIAPSELSGRCAGAALGTERP